MIDFSPSKYKHSFLSLTENSHRPLVPGDKLPDSRNNWKAVSTMLNKYLNE
jgi:hypothetical protein